MHISRLVLAIMFSALLIACGDDGETDPVDSSFGFVKPVHFPEPTYTFENNEVTRAGFELGKKIFFDPQLSVDGTIACSSCHDQTTAFADPQHRLSLGVEDRVGIRNAPQIANLAFMNNFFWDGGVIHVDFIPLNAIENPVEMDEDVSNVIRRLNEDPEYPPLFGEVFGTDTVTSPRMLHALSQFMTMLISATSPYDKHELGEEELEAKALEGLGVFETKCGSCHSGALFTDQSFRNNGLDSEFDDLGRGLITETAEDNGKFRVPSLRNVSLTAPYMHDGRFESIEEVLDHYTSGVVVSSTLDPLLNDGERLGIALTDDEKASIKAFLETLTDSEFVTNPDFFKL